MGSYRFNGFRSRAGNSGTEKGLVLQSETSRKSNVAIHPAVQHNFRHPVCDISICSRARAITLFSTLETGRRNFLLLTKLVSDHNPDPSTKPRIGASPQPNSTKYSVKRAKSRFAPSLLFCSANSKNKTPIPYC